MSVETPPFALSGAGATYTAEQTRRAMFPWAQRAPGNNPGIINGGLVGPSDMQIVAPASGLSVNIGVGEAIVGGDNGSQGGYYARNASTTNLTIATANGTNPRVDTVVAVVDDSAYAAPSGGFTANTWALAIVTGTPTASATLTNLSGAGVAPADSLVLGYVLVPKSATSIVAADISNTAQMIVPASNAFLQLLTQGTYRITFGGYYVTWGGTSGVSAASTVPHNLGDVPTTVLVTPQPLSAGGQYPWLNVQNLTSTSFGVVGAVGGSAPAAGTTSTFYFIAIG